MTGVPPLAPVANAVRIALDWSDGGDTGLTSTLFWRYSGAPPTGADCASLASAIYPDVAVCVGLLDIESALQGVRITDLSDPDGGNGEHIESTQGTRSGTVLAGGTAALVNFTINRRYRGGKPRISPPFGVSSDLVNRQTWESSFQTAVTSWMVGLTAAINGSVSGATTLTAHINVSYYEGSDPATKPSGRVYNKPRRRVPPVTDLVLNAACSISPSSQRRRNRLR